MTNSTESRNQNAAESVPKIHLIKYEFGTGLCPKCYSDMEAIGIEGDAQIYGCTKCNYTNQPQSPTGSPGYVG